MMTTVGEKAKKMSLGLKGGGGGGGGGVISGLWIHGPPLMLLSSTSHFYLSSAGLLT